MVEIDIVYFKNMTFVVCTSRGIWFVTLEYVNDGSKMALIALIKKSTNLYSKRTLKVTTFCMDPKFDPMQENMDTIDTLEGTTLNTTSDLFQPKTGCSLSLSGM